MPHHTNAETMEGWARARSRIEDRCKLRGGRGTGRAVGGLVHPARQAERLVPRSERVLPVDQDRGRTPEPGRLGLLGSLHQPALHRQTTTACDIVEAFSGDLPVRTVTEVQQFQLHGASLSRSGLRSASYRKPSTTMEGQGVSMFIGELAAQSGITAKTIRFWEAKGLLPDATRTTSEERRVGNEGGRTCRYR